MEQATCGEGLAENSALPAKLAELMAAVADNLEAHLVALDPADDAAKRERAAYQQLVRDRRALAEALAATAERMASQRDLPMGRHDRRALAAPTVLENFEEYVRCKRELVGLLESQANRDQELLVAMAAAATAG